MMGAPEVTNLNAVLIRSLGAKKVIDVGVFTGASSLAAALALPDGENIFVYIQFCIGLMFSSFHGIFFRRCRDRL